MTEPIQIGYALVTSIAVLALLVGKTKAQYKKGVVMAAIWIVIGGMVFAGVIYWPELKNSKFYNSLVAGSAVVNKNGSLEFTRANDGHFHINAKVNGVDVRFMLDTGAADIVLNKTDAERAGYHMAELPFNKLYSTANGTTRGASVKLKNLAIGSYQTGEIYASVNEGELENSLLGMSFLNHLQSYYIERDKLVLNP